MRHDQPTTPFDVEADDLTQQFWGASKGWVSSEQPTVRRNSGAHRQLRGDDTTGSLRAIREGFAAFRPRTSSHATGEIRRQRQHGTTAAVPQHVADHPARSDRDAMSETLRSARREATLGELAAGRSDIGGWLGDDMDDTSSAVDRPTARVAAPRRRPASARAASAVEGWPADELDDEPEYDVPLSPVQPLVDRLGLGAVDPLLVRVGVAILALVLMVPVMLSLRPDRSDDSLPGEVVEVPSPAVGAAPPVAAIDPTTVTAPAAAVVSTVDAASSSSGDTSSAAPEPESTTDAGVSSDRAIVETVSQPTDTDTQSDAASVDVVAERLVPLCPQTYTAALGDSWYRIADAAGIPPSELLAENNATTDTVILPGDDICLPEGAAVPAPPTTTVATTPSDDAPTTTTVVAERPSTTAPTTTVAPVANLSRSEVQQLIRDTWPAEEVETALRIAERESNFVATADNGWCCVGVFQLYWSVHRSWLDDFGIAQRSDLYDARKNIAAAFHMWQSQGWGPWGG